MICGSTIPAPSKAKITPNPKPPRMTATTTTNRGVAGRCSSWESSKSSNHRRRRLLADDAESRETDDAYTEGNAIAFAPKVSGYVTQLNIDDNTIVHAGDLLLKIDPRDYIAARDQAQAALSLAQAQLSSAQVDLEITRTRAPATLLQAQAQLAQAQANQSQAQRDYQPSTRRRSPRDHADQYRPGNGATASQCRDSQIS